MDILDQILAEERTKAYSDSKGGYTKTTKTVVFPESTVSYSDEGEYRGYRLAVETEMVAGKEYTVVVDGKTYVLTSVAQESEGATGIVLDCTDGKWVIVYIHNLVCAFNWKESKTGTTTDVTISITTKDKTIVPIDPKFLPGVCLPVVELSQETMAGVFDSGTATCTAEEHAIVWGAYQALYPLIIKGNYNGIAFSGVSNILLDNAHTPYFEANAGAMKVQVAFDDKTANIRSVQQ